jgi:hypothetical protein
MRWHRAQLAEDAQSYHCQPDAKDAYVPQPKWPFFDTTKCTPLYTTLHASQLALNTQSHYLPLDTTLIYPWTHQ